MAVSVEECLWHQASPDEYVDCWLPHMDMSVKPEQLCESCQQLLPIARWRMGLTEEIPEKYRQLDVPCAKHARRR